MRTNNNAARYSNTQINGCVRLVKEENIHKQGCSSLLRIESVQALAPDYRRKGRIAVSAINSLQPLFDEASNRSTVLADLALTLNRKS